MYDTTGMVANHAFESWKSIYRLKTTRARNKVVVSAPPTEPLLHQFVRARQDATAQYLVTQWLGGSVRESLGSVNSWPRPSPRPSPLPSPRDPAPRDLLPRDLSPRDPSPPRPSPRDLPHDRPPDVPDSPDPPDSPRLSIATFPRGMIVGADTESVSTVGSIASIASITESGRHELLELVTRVQHRTESELADLRTQLYGEIQALFRLLYQIEQRLEDHTVVHVRNTSVSNVGDTTGARLLTSVPIRGPELGERVAFEIKCQIRGPVTLEMRTVAAVENSSSQVHMAPVEALVVEWPAGSRVDIITGYLVNRYTGLECVCTGPESFAGSTQLMATSIGFLEFWTRASESDRLTLLEVSWFPPISMQSLDMED